MMTGPMLGKNSEYEDVATENTLDKACIEERL